MAQKTAYLERSVDPVLGEVAWQQADSLAVWTLDHLLETPGSESLDDFPASGFSRDLLTLP